MSILCTDHCFSTIQSSKEVDTNRRLLCVIWTRDHQKPEMTDKRPETENTERKYIGVKCEKKKKKKTAMIQFCISPTRAYLPSLAHLPLFVPSVFCPQNGTLVCVPLPASQPEPLLHLHILEGEKIPSALVKSRTPGRMFA